MRVLIDAWNVLHVQGVLPPGLAGLDLVGLGRLLQATRWSDWHATLVCDGGPEIRPNDIPEAIHLLWSGSAEADDVIEALVEDSSSPSRLLVVSSDRRLQRAARKRRCKWLTSQDFLRTILEDLASRGGRDPDLEKATPDTTPSEWASQFALDQEAIAAIEAEVDAADLESLLSDPPKERTQQVPDAPPAPVEDVNPSTARFPEDIIEQARRIASGK